MKAHIGQTDHISKKQESQEVDLAEKREYTIQGKLTKSEVKAIAHQESMNSKQAAKHLPEIHMDKDQVGCIDRKGGRIYFEYNLNGSLKSMTDSRAGGLKVKQGFDGHWYDQDRKVYERPQIDMKTGNVNLIGRGGDKTTFELDGTITKCEKHIQPKDLLKLYDKNSKIMDMNYNGRLEVGEIDAAMFNPALAGGEDRQFVKLLHDNRSTFAKGTGESMFHAVHREDIVKLHHRFENSSNMSDLLNSHFSRRLDKILNLTDKNHTGTITSNELRFVLNNWSHKMAADHTLNNGDKRIIEKLLRNYTETRNLADHKLESKNRGISRADLTEFHRNLIVADYSRKNIEFAISKAVKH